MRKFNIINKLQKQRGAALLLMVVILVVGAMAMLVNSLSASSLQLRRDKATADALAQAREALIGYAAAVDLSGSNRPGDLPCPDLTNDGTAEASCGSAGGSNQAQRLGRLPWKTLGLSDLRDGSGERLWYAVSNNFKKNFRTPILNTETTGTITVRASNGSLLHDASSNSGAVAILIAPGEAIQRTDQAAMQDRSTLLASNTAINYLEIANGEDNANFDEITTPSNGFIQGRIKDATNKLILNDQIMVISRDAIMQAIQKRVTKEISNALDAHFATYHFYPRPAAFSDSSCTGNNSLISCNSGASNRGRIPANPAIAWVPSILRGTASGNWFQSNAWREVIYYTVAPACTNGTTYCSGTGYLTLNNPPAAATVNQKVILISTGDMTGTQNRSGMMGKYTLSNYLEDENLSPLDDTYTRSASMPFNDYVIAIP